MTAKPYVQTLLYSLILAFVMFSTSWIAVSLFSQNPNTNVAQEEHIQKAVNAYLSQQAKENVKKHTANVEAKAAEKDANTTTNTSSQAAALPKEKIETIIHDYIMENPQVIEMAALKLREQQFAQQQKQQTEAIKRYSDQIFNASHDYIAGNPNGDVTIVEFFDYNCGFCKRAFGDLARLIEDDPQVRVVFKELPIFGASSQAAARAAIASIKQEKYFEFHRELLVQDGPADEEKAVRIAQELGMNVEKLKSDMESDEVRQALELNMELSQNLGVEGTPFYIVGNDVIPGAPEDLYDQFVAKVQSARASKNEAKSVAN